MCESCRPGVTLPSLVVCALALGRRDVAVGPDGNIYVATELSSGGNDATGTILRIEPVD